MSGRLRGLWVGLFVGSLFAATAGCGGGGSPASNNVAHPLVRQFSPTMSPIDFSTGQANPTFTDGNLGQSEWMYICVRGAGRIEVMNIVTGGRPVTPDRTPAAPPADRISIPGVRFVATTCSQ